jgi:hypothetical protein
MFAEVAERLKLSTTVLPLKENGTEVRAVEMPAFQPRASIPPPLATIGSRLFVFSRKQAGASDFMSKFDGMLGQHWFAGRVWTFDYPGRRLLWRAAGDLPPHTPEHEVKLGFPTRLFGGRASNFASIPVRVDGETIYFLLDTGATDVLPEDVLKAVGDGRPADRATSFLTQSQFEKWHQRHPQWRVLEKIRTLSGGAMIEVPEVVVGGYTTGPVWFTVQPDRAFHQYMASMMDRPTEGALGGSAMRHLIVTVDWPGALAVFERPK